MGPSPVCNGRGTTTSHNCAYIDWKDSFWIEVRFLQLQTSTTIVCTAAEKFQQLWTGSRWWQLRAKQDIRICGSHRLQPGPGQLLLNIQLQFRKIQSKNWSSSGDRGRCHLNKNGIVTLIAHGEWSRQIHGVVGSWSAVMGHLGNGSALGLNCAQIFPSTTTPKKKAPCCITAV